MASIVWKDMDDGQDLIGALTQRKDFVHAVMCFDQQGDGKGRYPVYSMHKSLAGAEMAKDEVIRLSGYADYRIISFPMHK